MTAPLSVVALGLGFLAQQAFTEPRSSLDAKVMEALLPATAADDPDRQSEARQLEEIQARRADAAIPPPSSGMAPSGDLALAEPAAGRPVPLEARVALLRQAGRPTLSARGPWQLLDGDGRVLLRGGPGESVDWSSQGSADLWLESAGGQALLVNGLPYEGRLRLLREGSGITPINHLPLERYIASVVGAEMPSSWSMEALKAQAVAARSYALAHLARPANRYWHLGDTTRWQAYRGLESVTARTREATERTNGLILSYQGGIVESLYAANSQITLEAHGHLGASMSQEGAQQLAIQGQRYNQILGHYYQGASLARLQIGGAN
ncbi:MULTISPECIES: SpoIID/LytB domain-containing protein [unclassified Synechococcus]|uniref:SpoIID/LytB domain-containing protein n=1 Tax=unclassified Synechococcus TaxID=2626047 RepID=UPI0020CC4313|nr:MULTISPECIES: SpoIID/LytB domain-containing protein [unclassified Synechococcus]